MTSLVPALVVTAATALIGLRETSPQRRGDLIESMLAAVGLCPDAPWHTAFVSHAGYWALFDHDGNGSLWPLVKTGDPNVLYQFARDKGIVRRDRPVEGDISLMWSTRERCFVQSGIVTAVDLTPRWRHGQEQHSCITIEGNTDMKGGLNGPGVYRVVRTFVPDMGDRFIRWADLDARAAIGNPSVLTKIVAGRRALMKAA